MDRRGGGGAAAGAEAAAAAAAAAVPVLRIVKGRHPMLEASMAQRGDEQGYIPNTLTLGGVEAAAAAGSGSEARFVPKMLLLSGPNMGGKSTLLRQTCLIAILAQMGCKVPADSCALTPVDRIFTRVGASDRILAGQSTFYVELAETASILHLATEDSLAILDELGRGTATFDGTAIAHAVVDHLVQRTRCRALFATHYHSLVDDWEVDARVQVSSSFLTCVCEGVRAQRLLTSPPSCPSTTAFTHVITSWALIHHQLGHMKAVVEDDGDAAPAEGAEGSAAERVSFMYELEKGSSPKSYGINVARLARLPAQVIALATQQSRQFEERMRAGDGTAGGAVGAAALRRDAVAAFFDRLVSIAHSRVPKAELVYLASEMWRRYSAWWCAVAKNSDMWCA